MPEKNKMIRKFETGRRYLYIMMILTIIGALSAIVASLAFQYFYEGLVTELNLRPLLNLVTFTNLASFLVSMTVIRKAKNIKNPHTE